MRITEGMKFSSVQRSLAELRSRQSTVSDQISTGRRVLAPSTDPVAAAELTRVAANLVRTSDLRETVGSARGNVGLIEGTLSEASGLFVRARELALQGANGSLSGEDRRMLALEVSSLRDHLVSLANARGEGGSLFAGTLTDSPAFSEDGVYQGNEIEHEVEIAPGVIARVAVTGAQAFTALEGGTDAFVALQELENALLADDAQAVSASLDGLDGAREQIVRTQAETGLIINRLDSADQALETTELELVRVQSRRGDVDSFRALSELSDLSTSLEQAIGVARIILNNNIDRF